MLDILYQTYPELIEQDLRALGIVLQDDSDDKGVWLVSWDYSQPIPKGIKVGK
jgi:hypothetical protein